MYESDEIDSYMLNLDDSSSEEDFPESLSFLPDEEHENLKKASTIAEKWREFLSSGTIRRMHNDLKKAAPESMQEFTEKIRISFILHLIGTELLFTKDTSQEYYKLKKRHLYQSDVRLHDELMRHWLNTSISEALEKFNTEDMIFNNYNDVTKVTTAILKNKRLFLGGIEVADKTHSKWTLNPY